MKRQRKHNSLPEDCWLFVSCLLVFHLFRGAASVSCLRQANIFPIPSKLVGSDYKMPVHKSDTTPICFTNRWWRIKPVNIQLHVSVALQMLSFQPHTRTHNNLIHGRSNRQKNQNDLSQFIHCEGCIRGPVSWSHEETVLVFTGSTGSVMQVPRRFCFIAFYPKHLPSAWSAAGLSAVKRIFSSTFRFVCVI